MKKYIAIFAVILVIVAGILFVKSQDAPSPDKEEESTTVDLSDLFFVQYRVYAPENAVVTLDGKVLSYNKNIDCFSTEIKDEGNYTLTIAQEGCESIVEKVYISTESNEYKAELDYTSDFLSEAQNEGKKLLESIMHKCWNLSYDLSEYDFLSEEERIACESMLADVVSALEENLSAGYTTSDFKVTLTPLSVLPNEDNGGSSVFISFESEFSYDWQFNGDAYSDSGSKDIISKASILIERNNGKWYIRDISLHLYNGTM